METRLSAREYRKDIHTPVIYSFSIKIYIKNYHYDDKEETSSRD